MTATVAVVIPTHGRPDFLGAALDSVFAQRSTPSEVIVVSDDDDAEAAEVVSAAATTAAVPVRHVRRRGAPGASASRNYGAALTSAEMLAFLDDDDEWEDDFLERAVACIEDRGVDAAVAHQDVREDERVLWQRRPEEGLRARDVYLRGPSVTGSSLVLTREAFAAVGGFDSELPVQNDRDFFLRLLAADRTYAVSDARPVRVRKHSRGQLTDASPLRARGVLAFMRKHRRTYGYWASRPLRRQYHRMRITIHRASPRSVWHLFGVILNSPPPISRRAGRPRNVYVTVTGQDDNLGDSVLRRGLINVLRHPEGVLHVLTGPNSPAYCSALGLRSDDVVYGSKSRWTRALWRDALLLKRPLFVLNAGEMRAEPGHAYLGWKRAARLPLLRALGVDVTQSGVGLRHPDAAHVAHSVKAGVRMLKPLAWRDAPSAMAAGRGQVFPDWAFYADSSPLATRAEGIRSALVVSMRGDRSEPSPEWIAVVRGLSERLELRIVVVNQVKRDEARTRELAAALGAAAVDVWGDASHAQREVELRRIYRTAAAVVSDRLHVLILAATEGAVPLGLTVDSPEKVARTLAVVNMDRACIRAVDRPVAGTIDVLVEAVRNLDPLVLSAGARRRLATFGEDMHRSGPRR